MNNLRVRWQQKSLRERRLLIGAAVLFSLCLLYYAIWLPWQQREEQWRQTLTREKNTQVWMRQQAPEIVPPSAPAPAAEALSLSATIAQTASASGIAITRLQPQGERLGVTVMPCEFNALMQWITQLEQQHQVQIVGFDVTAQNAKPGWVSVNRLVVTRNDAKQSVQPQNKRGSHRAGAQDNNGKDNQ